MVQSQWRIHYLFYLILLLNLVLIIIGLRINLLTMLMRNHLNLLRLLIGVINLLNNMCFLGNRMRLNEFVRLLLLAILVGLQRILLFIHCSYRWEDYHQFKLENIKENLFIEFFMNLLKSTFKSLFRDFRIFRKLYIIYM
jgi:hypothetical protein